MLYNKVGDFNKSVEVIKNCIKPKLMNLKVKGI